MKNKINILLAAVNVLLILVYLYVSQRIFLGAYTTYLFWGISLYVFTSSCIMLTNNKQAKVMQWGNVLLTVISIAWFVIYMPAYTPGKAIEVLKESGEFDSTYAFYVDESNPVEEGAVGALFVRSAYNIVAVGKDKLNVKFNPVSGKYNVETDADSISRSLISLPGDGYYTIDEEFMAKLGDTENSYHEILALLRDYMGKWQSKLDYCYNTLYNLLSEDSKAILEEDQTQWENSRSEQKLRLENMYSNEYGDGYKLDLLRYESECRAVRERALYLNDILSKFSVDDSI